MSTSGPPVGRGRSPDKEVVLSREKVLGQEACPEQGAALNGEIVLDRRALPGWRMVLRRVKLRERRSVLRQEMFLGGEIVLSQGRRLEGALYPGTGIVSSRGIFSSRWSVCAAERGLRWGSACPAGTQGSRRLPLVSKMACRR